MLPKSIRWRFPLSYAGIALLATLALGAVLLITLRSYYAAREQRNFNRECPVDQRISLRACTPTIDLQEQINTQINTLSFVSQARIQLYDTQGHLLADSGDPSEKQMLTMNCCTRQCGA